MTKDEEVTIDGLWKEHVEADKDAWASLSPKQQEYHYVAFIWSAWTMLTLFDTGKLDRPKRERILTKLHSEADRELMRLATKKTENN